MKKTTVAWLLKAVLILCACGVLVAAGNLLPMYMNHVRAVRPELSGWYGWMIAYGWTLAIPALVALLLLWRVFGTIAADEAFCEQNARRFKRVWQLCTLDLALLAGMGLFLWINHVTPPFLVTAVAGLLFLGVAAAIVCFALSGLCESAAKMREENEMTV